MRKNPHAVALGRLGGVKGGRARAKTLSAKRRTMIARRGGQARSRALSSSQRSAIARRAATARWGRSVSVQTAADAPEAVRRLLKTYDPADLRWDDAAARYTVVREILVRGDRAAHRWLDRILTRAEVRKLVSRFRGMGCTEPERARLRDRLGLTTRDLPERPYLKALWVDDG